jgi:hypothetical protein
MNDPSPERIAVTFNPSADDYARYVAAVDRRTRSWPAFSVWVAVFFCAIPVALLFRVLASERHIADPGAIEMAGKFGLFAFVFGVFAAWIGFFAIRRMAQKRYFETTVAWPGPRTIELDHIGITQTTKATQSKWQWSAVNRCTLERGLLLMWIAPTTAVPIPSRSFGSEAACAAALAFVRTRLSEASARLPRPRDGDAAKPDSGGIAGS